MWDEEELGVLGIVLQGHGAPWALMDAERKGIHLHVIIICAMIKPFWM